MKFTITYTFIRALCCTAAALMGTDAIADASVFSPIFGGPAFVASTQTGYVSPETPTGFVVNDIGMAIGSANKFDLGSGQGYRAVRWDGSGTPATELGTLGGEAHALGMNNSGASVGWSEKWTPDGYRGERAVRWAASGTIATELGNLGTTSIGETYGRAFAVNGSGTAVGYSQKYVSGTDVGERAVRWSGSGTAATELGNLGTTSFGTTSSRASAVNTSGTAVGYAFRYVSGQNRGQRAVSWAGSNATATELISTLGTTSNGTTTSSASAVNDSGTAVGFAKKYVSGVDMGYRAVRWASSGSVSTELGNLGTASGGSTDAFAYAVNSSGTAVGSALKYVGGSYFDFHAVRWDASGTAATELGQLGIDGWGSAALAVNDSGTAVGRVRTSADISSDRAVAWRIDGIPIDLNTLIDPTSGWTLKEAHGISNTDWITGLGRFDPDGPGGDAAYDRLFVMHMIPEPATSLLAVSAILGVLARRNRGALIRIKKMHLKIINN